MSGAPVSVGSRDNQTKGVAVRHLSGKSRLVAGDHVVSCDLAGGAALLNVRTSVYSTLNEVGARIWSIIQTPVTVSEIVDVLTAQYKVDAGRCRDDIIALLQQLDDAELIEILDAAPAQIPDPEQVG